MKKLLPVWVAICLAGFLSWVIVFPTFSDEYPEGISVLRLAAAGDVIMHLPIVKSGYQKESNTYDFRPCFAEIKDYLSSADLAVCVLETPLAAPNDRNYTGYPTFNAPPAIADALQWAGIDLVFTAHNHSLDRGAAGIRNTLAYLDKIGLPQTGSRKSPDQKEYQIIEKNGFKLGFLSYTTLTNGIPLPAEAPYMLNLLDYEKLAQNVKELRASGVDAIILALHTGVEYQRQPSREQLVTVNHLLQAGVDIILGSHVHVIQPYEFREVALPGTTEAKTCFVAYSLGNLLSNQQWRYSDCGLMTTLELEKSSRKPGLRIRQLNHLPVWVYRYPAGDGYQYRIMPVRGPEADGSDPTLSVKARNSMREVWEDTETLLKNWHSKSAAGI